MGGEAPSGEHEACEDLRLYLSGRLPPQRLAGFLPRLAVLPVPRVAREIRDWARRQSGPAGSAERLSLALRRFLTLHTGAGDEKSHGAFVRAVVEAVYAQTITSELDRPSAARASGPGAALPGVPRFEAPAAKEGHLPQPAASARRLTFILDRLAATPTGGAREPSARLVAEAVLTTALAASSAEELERGLADLRRRGVARDTALVFRVLVEALPPWPLPDLTSRTAPAAAAIERVVTLTPSPAETTRRFFDLVEAGVGAFNRGALERSGLVFGVAERLLDRGVVEAASVERLRTSGHERLDLERLRRLLEGQDRREIPRTLLRFYRVFDPEALLDKLRREPARARRRLLLSFLEAHGGEGRSAAFERLRRSPADAQDVFLLRNLVHLLRRIPAGHSPWLPGRELGRVVRLLVPENPTFLVREVLDYLVESRQAASEQALLLFLGSLEDALLTSPAGTAEEKRRWTSHLDETCAALVRYGTPAAWQAVVRHGLRHEPALGRSAARLEGLGAVNLAGRPDLVAALAAAARAALPRGPLDRPTQAESRRLRHVLAALAGTRGPDAQELFEAVAERFADHELGRWAAEILASAGAAEGPGSADPTGTGLSGDLRIFGLPTLLQSLAESRATGLLRILDGRGRREATLELEGGRLVDARRGRLAGPDVLYQMLERPTRGSFVFAPRPGGDAEAGGGGREIMELLLEGLRRHDELRRASVIVPDDARLETTEIPPRAVPGEEDIDLVTALWERVVAGSTPRECELVLAADAYRVRRCLAHWVEEGTLRLRPADAGRR